MSLTLCAGADGNLSGLKSVTGLVYNITNAILSSSEQTVGNVTSGCQTITLNIALNEQIKNMTLANTTAGITALQFFTTRN